jgi:hypothetical protein
MPALRTIAVGFAMAAAITVISIPSASAGTIQNGYSCQSGLAGWQEVYSVTVNVPATAHQGDTITVTGSTTGTTSRSGARPAGYYVGSLGVMVGGATSSSVSITGMTSPAARDGDPFALAGGSGRITLNNVGVVTFKPNSWSNALASDTRYGWTCFDADGVIPTAASINVLAR